MGFGFPNFKTGRNEIHEPHQKVNGEMWLGIALAE